jgi:hypothetical protein
MRSHFVLAVLIAVPLPALAVAPVVDGANNDR